MEVVAWASVARTSSPRSPGFWNRRLEACATISILQGRALPKEPPPSPANCLPMWQRFTEEARIAIYFAQDEADAMGERLVDTEHLLLGLTRQKECAAFAVLQELGVSEEALRDEVLRQRGVAEPLKGGYKLSARGKRAIDLAYDAARKLGSAHIETSHLLLGLVGEPEGAAGRALAQLGVGSKEAFRRVGERPNTERIVPAKEPLWTRILRAMTRKRPPPESP